MVVPLAVRIAFDLDDTLIPTGGRFATEPPSGVWPLRSFATESLRVGASTLLRELRGEGHAVWVYTSSARSVAAVHVLFAAYGVRLGGVVNLDRHEAMVRRLGVRRLKHARAFGIELLVDDSVAVVEEATRFGGAALLVAPEDAAWDERVREAVRVRSAL